MTQHILPTACSTEQKGPNKRRVPPAAILVRPVVVVIVPNQALITSTVHPLHQHGVEIHHIVANLHQAMPELQRLCPDVVIAHIDALAVRANGDRHALAPGADLPPLIVVAPSDRQQELARAVSMGAVAGLELPLTRSALIKALRRGFELHTLQLRAHAMASSTPQSVGELHQTEHRFRNVLAGLYMAWQPIYSARNFQPIGYEALVRSTEPSTPTARQVLDLADQLGRSSWLDRQILTSCAQQLRQLSQAESLFVNISVRQFTDGVMGTADDPLAPFAARVVLEVTDDQPIPDIATFTLHSARLRSAGYRIALPELGSGRDYLARLLAFQPDIFKLGRDSWFGCESNPRKHRFVRMIVEMAKDEGAQVVAEGIETLSQARAAMDLGCELLQGYLLGRPASSAHWSARRPRPLLGES